jgi:hypothetical protein
VPDERDTGLKTMMTWNFAALVFTLILTYFAVTLAIKYFDRP